MKCNCCDNRIWVEPSTKNEVEIFTKKKGVETGICLSIEDTEFLIEDLQKEIERVKSQREAIFCTQCSERTTLDEIKSNEGYCKSCCSKNQNELDQHNLEFDRWQNMTDKQRDFAIGFELR